MRLDWRIGALTVCATAFAAAAAFAQGSPDQRTYRVSSASMEPGFVEGDQIIARLGDSGPLGRGDVVLVTVRETVFLVRIVALPGDRIALANGVVAINGQPVPQRRIGTQQTRDTRSGVAEVLQEQLPGEAHPHRILNLRESPQDNTPETQLPPNHYFVLGDNRDNSMDSRFPANGYRGLGLVRRDRIIGKVQITLP